MTKQATGYSYFVSSVYQLTAVQMSSNSSEAVVDLLCFEVSTSSHAQHNDSSNEI